MSIDREALIDSLERLSSEDDAEVLTAAREAVERLTKAELDWDEVIREGLSAAAALPEIDLDEDDASIQKAITTLLAKPDLNESTADDLRDFLADLEKGELDPDDRKYVLGLYARVAG